MSRHHSHITSAIKIIETAAPGEPLVHHLKKFFAADKKFGSKDRKSIASLCYNYYRIGKALQEKSIGEKIIAGTFLCITESNEFLGTLAHGLNEKIHLPTEEKCALLKITPADIFPFSDDISEAIDPAKYAASFLSQPLLFLRLRPGKTESILAKLREANTSFEEISPSCIALPPASKLNELIKINKDAVVQDRNSQEVFRYLQQHDDLLNKESAVWDCCAASGGKSILLYDLSKGNISLHVSDVRENILNNLRNRFKDAGIISYTSSVADLEKDLPNATQEYDIIICDAPCTGSGTWARTPEQISFFNRKNIYQYAEKQKKIASATISKLNKDGIFFYITCSVFKNENEAVVNYLKEKFHLQLLQMEYLKGYELRADTMFVAVLKK